MIEFYFTPSDPYNNRVIWNLGAEAPHLCHRNVSEVFADGEEYLAIVEAFNNIPIARSNNLGMREGFRWRGAFAQIIVDNLRLVAKFAPLRK